MKNDFLVLGFLVPTLLLLAALACIAIGPPAEPDPLPPRVLAPPPAGYLESIAAGQMLARSLVSEQNLPGLSLAIAVDGEIIWAEGFGWSDYERRRPVTPTTRYRIGSVTKTITAAAAALLCERGRLDLDAPVQSYVPTFPEKDWPITTRQLMSHVAGIRHHKDHHEIFRRTPCANDRERLAIFANDPLRFRPGTAFAYSTYGYVLVGAVVAAAADEPWLQFVQREILVPLGMLDTIADIEGNGDPERTPGYFPRMNQDPRYGLQRAPRVDLSCILPAAGLLSTPSDLVRFASSMMKGTLLSQETVNLLWTSVRLESGEETEAGSSWYVRWMAGGENQTLMRIIGHGGNVSGGSASLVTVPDQGIAFAVTTNVTYADVASLSAQLVEIFASQVPRRRQS